MNRQPKACPLETALATVAALAPPRSQAEWRKVSTAIRHARRLARERRQAWTPKVESSPGRYLSAWTYGREVSCYNGACRWTSFHMGQRARQMHAEGWRDGRATDARMWFQHSRRYNIPLPA